MARNEEKAQAMLNRWVSMKRQLIGKAPEKRPNLASDVNSLNDCEKWRSQIIREIAKKVQEIQNAGLGEHKIRDLNDEINKLIREKGHWEDRIKELGGADYKRSGAKVLDAQGVELPGSGGYKYFGAAKDLPGVRELFQNDAPNPPKKSRQDLYKNINFEYYGLKDEENEEMLYKEHEYEQQMFNEVLEEWISKNKELIQSRFKGVKNPLPKEIFKLIDEDTLQTFKAQHETSEALYKNYKSEIKEDELKNVLDMKKKKLLDSYFPKEDSDEEAVVKKIIYEKD